MTLELPAELEAQLVARAQASGLATVDFVREALMQTLSEQTRHEAAVLEGLESPATALTVSELAEVRGLIRAASACATRP